MGAWIETKKTVYKVTMNGVAPLVGAWIETLHHRVVAPKRAVAPLVGAWIETIIRVLKREV